MCPLYEIGEEVLLVSHMHPNLNGPTQVLSVVRATPTPDGICTKCKYAYELTTPNVASMSRWHECALRKKYDGVERDELMGVLELVT